MHAAGGVQLLVEACVELAASAQPGDAAFACGPLLLTLLRLASSPASRPFAPPAPLCDAIVAAFVDGEGLAAGPGAGAGAAAARGSPPRAAA